MLETRVCSVCGVPRRFSKLNAWNEDGTITQARNPDHRLFLCEAECFDNIFRNIEELMGVPIDRIVIEGKRKATLDYLGTMISGALGAVLRTLMRRQAYGMVASTGAVMGYGHYELEDFKRGEYLRVFGRDIYCLSLISADLIAIFNFMEKLPADLNIEGRGPGKVITVSHGREFERELVDRLPYVSLPRKPGRLHLERCPGCGLPVDLKSFTWSMGQGVITDNVSGRRMTVMGPNEVDSIFGELEAELGEDIPRTIVRAQSRYLRGLLQPDDIAGGTDRLTRQLALRGMGNLVHFEMGRDEMEAKVENASPYLMVAGIIQGLLEASTGKEADCFYGLAPDGTLTVRVKSL